MCYLFNISIDRHVKCQPSYSYNKTINSTDFPASDYYGSEKGHNYPLFIMRGIFFLFKKKKDLFFSFKPPNLLIW